MSQNKISKYKFGGFTIDLKTETLRHGATIVPLTHKAWQVLLVLVENANQTVSKDEIYNRIWSDSFVEEANLTQYIYLLRKCLTENSFESESYIETVPRHGYRFAAQVTAVAEPTESLDETKKSVLTALATTVKEPDAVSVTSLFQDQQLTENSDAPNKTIFPSSNRFDRDFTFEQTVANPSRFPGNKAGLLAIVGAALLLVVGFTVFSFYYLLPSAAEEVKSLAVLPFTMVGDSGADAKLGLGIADATITRLGGMDEISVRPTSAVLRYHNQPAVHSITAGRDLGVDFVVEGTIQNDGKIMRVSVRLISVADGKLLWAEHFNEKIDDVFLMQDILSSQISESLIQRITMKQALIINGRKNFPLPKGLVLCSGDSHL